MPVGKKTFMRLFLWEYRRGVKTERDDSPVNHSSREERAQLHDFLFVSFPVAVSHQLPRKKNEKQNEVRFVPSKPNALYATKSLRL